MTDTKDLREVKNPCLKETMLVLGSIDIQKVENGYVVFESWSEEGNVENRSVINRLKNTKRLVFADKNTLLTYLTNTLEVF